jgi:preprotein translocase subunit YajC
MISFFSQLPLLQAAANPGGQMMTMLITFGLIIFIFYFLVIRPQNKKQKEAKRMIEALKKGDKVVTIGGIRGQVTSVKEQTVTVKIDTDTKIEINKSAVSSVLEKKESPAKSKE